MMESSIVAMLLLTATLVLGVGVFAFYSVSFSAQYYTVSVQEHLIGLSKLISVEVSQPTFTAVLPYYNYFNVSYVIWIQSPTKTLTVVPFVASPQPNPFYILPSSAQNASLFTSSLNGYSGLRPFNLSATVYLPQGGQPLGSIHAVAYNVSSNSTYVLSAVLRPGQIIMLWLLYYYDGKWYRLDYVYLDPPGSGIGIYIVLGTGMYMGYSGSLSNPTPHIYLSKTGYQFGMWFEVVNIHQSPTLLLNTTLVPTGTTKGRIIWVLLYTQGSSLYVNISGNVKLLYNNLKVGQPYFINITGGSQFSSQLPTSHAMNFTIYNRQGQLLNSTVLNLPQEINGYTTIISFGTKTETVANGISQAFLETMQNQQGTNSFWNVSNIALHNGPLYNDTYLINWTIAHNRNLYSVVYWYFVWPNGNPPPPQLPGLEWYWPSGTSRYPYIYYVPEIGTNTYLLI